MAPGAGKGRAGRTSQDRKEMKEEGEERKGSRMEGDNRAVVKLSSEEEEASNSNAGHARWGRIVALGGHSRWSLLKGCTLPYDLSRIDVGLYPQRIRI
eukprot:767925-Hanusia_phi.AAC.2